MPYLGLDIHSLETKNLKGLPCIVLFGNALCYYVKNSHGWRLRRNLKAVFHKEHSLSERLLRVRLHSLSLKQKLISFILGRHQSVEDSGGPVRVGWQMRKWNKTREVTAPCFPSPKGRGRRIGVSHRGLRVRVGMGAWTLQGQLVIWGLLPERQECKSCPLQRLAESQANLCGALEKQSSSLFPLSSAERYSALSRHSEYCPYCLSRRFHSEKNPWWIDQCGSLGIPGWAVG